MKKLTLIIALLSLFMNTTVHGQEEVQVDNSEVILYLKSGSRIEGKIISWEPNKSIQLSTTWGSVIRFDTRDVKKVIQKSTLAISVENPYNFKDQGIYYTVKGNFITGNPGNRAKSVNGIGFSMSAGHRFNRYLSVGAGLGWDQYVWNSGEELIPLFTEISGFLNESNSSLMYNLQVGYSIALKDQDYLMSYAKGGLMVYPSIGIRFGTNKTIKYTLDIGYKFQNAEFTYDDQWTFGTKSEQDLLYRRLTIRFGLLL